MNNMKNNYKQSRKKNYKFVKEKIKRSDYCRFLIQILLFIIVWKTLVILTKLKRDRPCCHDLSLFINVYIFLSYLYKLSHLILIHIVITTHSLLPTFGRHFSYYSLDLNC